MERPIGVGIAISLLLSWSLFAPQSAYADGELFVPPPGEACKARPKAGRYCDLAAAITAANAAGKPAIIRLSENACYSLDKIDHQREGGNGLPAVTGTLAIEGRGASISRSADALTPSFRLFRVEKGGDLTLRDVTLRNGRTEPGFDGAAIWNKGTLTIKSSVLEDHASGDDGGAIRSDGILFAEDSHFRRNAAGGRGGVGGALQTTTQFGPARSVIERSVFTGNQARATGGGMWLQGETLLSDTVLTGNRAEQRGGGIQNYGALEMRKVDISGNSAGMRAGGLHSFEPVRVVASSVIGNEALISADCQGVLLADAASAIGSSMGCSSRSDPGTVTPSSGGTPSDAAIAFLTERGASVSLRPERGGGPGRVVVSTGGAWRGRDADFAVLKDIEGLYKLRLGGKIGDQAIAHLLAIEGLSELDIHSVSVTDAGVVQLASVTTLKRLNLTYTKVTDEGLAALRDMRDLQWLGLAYTDVSAAGVEALRTALGDTIIEGNFTR